MVISLTYCICISWTFRRAQKEHRDLQTALDLCLMIMIGGLLGSRIFHILYEDFHYYQQYPWDVFKLWQGGFVFYGGFIGALVASAIYLRVKHHDFWVWADFMAPIAAFGYGFGRLACFLNGCCYGKECDLPWALEFHTIGLPTGPRHPTQLYATVWELGVMFLLLNLEKRRFRNLFLVWLALHAIGRLIMEHFREDFRGPDLMGMSISTVLSLGLLAVSLGLLARRSFAKPQS